MKYSEYPQNGAYDEAKNMQSLQEEVRTNQANADDLQLRMRCGICEDAGAEAQKESSGKAQERAQTKR
jgi:hypothetical protein